MKDKEKKYNAYDCECIVYLAVEIPKMLLLEEQHLYIDMFHDTILSIYEDYKKYDNENKSLLDSIHDYINEKENDILDKVSKCYDF